jgi:hypothetical protein
MWAKNGDTKGNPVPLTDIHDNRGGPSFLLRALRTPRS